MVLALFASCSPCARLARKCPPQIETIIRDSIVFKDTIIYRDRIVEIEIPADTTTDTQDISPILTSTYIEGDKELNIDPIRIENDYAKASAWVESSILKLELIQKEQVIEKILEDAEKEVISWKEKYTNKEVTKIVTEKYIPKIYKISLWVCITLLGSIILYVVYRIKGKL